MKTKTYEYLEKYFYVYECLAKHYNIHMKSQRHNYKKILDFIAWRAGYSGWAFTPNFSYIGKPGKPLYYVLQFTAKEVYDSNDIMISIGDSLHTLLFNCSDTPCKIIKRLLANKDDIFVTNGPCKQSNDILMKVFKDNDTLENLEIEADLIV